MFYRRLIASALALFVLLPLLAPQSSAAAPKSWKLNYPTAGSVTIRAGDTVLLDTNIALENLTILGQVICADKNLSASANWIMVHGLLQCGTPAAPFTKKLTITLTGADTNQNVMGMGTKFLGAMGGGKIVLHGENRDGWTRLAATANRGVSTIALKEAPPWRAGDSIVVVSTGFRAEHAEERQIAAISGNQVRLSAPLAYQHWCATSTFGNRSIEQCAEIGLLTRNIVIRGRMSPAAPGFGGHVMVMAGSSARISGVQFLNMGQRGKIGRYPMHWHMVGQAPGQYLVKSSIAHSFNRFLSIHGTHQIRLAGNVGYDTIGHGYYLEDGIETRNVIEDNLGVLVRNARDGAPTPSDKEAAVFWISNPDNIVRRNVAAGSEHTGFWLGFPEHPIGLSATNSVWPRRTRLREFSGNVSHSNMIRGLYVDGAENPDRTTSTTSYEPRLNPADPTSPAVPPVFKNFTGYKNRYQGAWIRSLSRPVLQSAKLADNYVGAHFISVSQGTGYVQDSLIVGETANKGNPESWETRGLDGRELPHFWSPSDSLRGLEFYQGPMAVRRTLFANFNSNSLRKSGSITGASPNPYWTSSLNTSSAITFHNSNRVWLEPITPNNDGDAYTVIRDSDGSITGVPGRRIVPRNPVLITPSCASRPDWNAYVCPHNYIGLQIVTDTSVDLTGSVLKRDDGATHVMGSTSDRGQLRMNLLEGRTHTLSLSITAPKRLSFVRQEQAGKAVRLSLPYAFSNFTVTLWGAPVANALSLGELAFGGTKYYYDMGAKRLHLRLVSTDGSWQSYVVKRP